VTVAGDAGWQPAVDVVICALNEEAYIGRCLEHVIEQDYDEAPVRIFVVDSGSTDDTLAIVQEYAQAEARLTVVADGKRRNLPQALNVGLALSDAELVAKIDAHGFPERDFLRRAVEAFRSVASDVACVGGRPIMEGAGRFSEAAALARTSRFGVAGSVYAGTRTREFVYSVGWGVYRRAALDEVGLFDERMSYGEDEEVNWRLRRAGHRILLDESIRFHYITRNNWRALFRQYQNYGRARVRVVRKHPEFLRARHLVPAAFVTSVVGLAAVAPFAPNARRALAALAAAYTTSALGFGFRAAGRRNPAIAARVAACFAALHLGYGVGTLAGVTDRFYSKGTPRG